MTLFQSAEYIRTLTHTLHALEDFTTAKQELLSEAMAALGLPTRREMDELYREMYLLKKSMKAHGPNSWSRPSLPGRKADGPTQNPG